MFLSKLFKTATALSSVICGARTAGLATATGLTPGGDDLLFHLVEAAVVESSSSVVFGEHGRVAVAETEAGVAFPVVAESVDLVEFDATVGVDEVDEHAAATDSRELAGSPTRTTRHSRWSARRARSASLGVAAVPASSTITVVPSGRS